MKGAADAKSQLIDTKKIGAQKIYEEQLKRASHQIVMEKNEYAKFTNSN